MQSFQESEPSGTRKKETFEYVYVSMVQTQYPIGRAILNPEIFSKINLVEDYYAIL